MRNVNLFIASSLDGFVARGSGELDWLYTDEDFGYRSFAATIDTVVMGRRTYEQSLASADYPFEGKSAFVFSRTLAGRQDERARFVDEPPARLVARLRSRPGGDIQVVGGGELVRRFLDEDLVDRVELFVHPVTLGSGFALFPQGGIAAPLVLEARETAGGIAHLSYARPVAMAA